MANTQKNDIKLIDFIDLNLLQEFQNSFAAATGMASIIVDHDGPMTEPSKFTDLCTYIRKNKKGFNRCNNCDIKWGELAAKKGEPIIYNCHSGLTDFAIPIIVEGQHVASILGGQVLQEEPDENKFREVAKELGIDENIYIQMLKKIKIIPYEKIKASAKLLFIASNSISTIAHKNYELKKKSKRENVYRNVLEAIRSSIKINDIKQTIVNEVGKELEAYRCIILTRNLDNDKFEAIDANSVYTASPDVCNLVGVTPEEERLTYFMDVFKNTKEPATMVTEKFITENELEETSLDIFFKKYNIKTAVCSPIIYSDKLFGILLLHYDNTGNCLSRERLDFITAISAQIGIALHQNRLFELEKKAAQREALLRKITESIRGNMEIDKTLSFICTEIAKLFNVQRVMISKFNDALTYADYIKKDCRINDEMKLSKFSKYDKDIINFVRESIVNSSPILAFDNITESKTPDYFKSSCNEFGLKSIIGSTIQKDNSIWGIITLFEYENYRFWSENDQILLNTLANQIYILIQQSELYMRTKQQTQREKAIINNLPFKAWLKDEKGRFLIVNELFGKQHNSIPQEIIGKTDNDIFPEDIAQKQHLQDLMVMESNKPITFEESHCINSEMRWFEVHKAPVGESMSGTTGLAIDITERKEMERIKNEFISMISHELRTPITSIRGALGLVTSGTLGNLPDKVQTLLNIAGDNSTRLVNLINDILDLEKINAGKIEFYFKDYNLMKLVEEALILNEEYAKQYSIKFRIKERLENSIASVDKDRFIQILTNLLSNASKFSFKNSTIDVSVRRENNIISISVTNRGFGIPESDYSKVFETFSQIGNFEGKRKGGTGLGLSISKCLTEKMNGNIGFTSKVNDKTTFYVEFPDAIKQRETDARLK